MIDRNGGAFGATSKRISEMSGSIDAICGKIGRTGVTIDGTSDRIARRVPSGAARAFAPTSA